MCHIYQFVLCVVVFQSLSCVRLFATPSTAACQASLSFTISWHLLRLMSIELAMWSSHLIFYFPFLFLPSTFPSIRVFSNESALHQVAKYWRFNLSISPSNEYSGLTSFRIDWFDLLAVQRTLKTTGLSSTTNRKHQFFSAQPTLWSIHDYWKNHSIDYVNLCWQTDVSVFS